MVQEAPSPTAFGLWSYLQDQFREGSSLLKSPQAPCHLQPLASGSHRWEKEGPCLCCGVAMGCWASTPPFRGPSLPPGSDLTRECYYCEHVLSSTGCLSHRGEGTTGAQSPRTFYPDKDNWEQM